MNNIMPQTKLFGMRIMHRIDNNANMHFNTVNILVGTEVHSYLVAYYYFVQLYVYCMHISAHGYLLQVRAGLRHNQCMLMQIGACYYIFNTF